VRRVFVSTLVLVVIAALAPAQPARLSAALEAALTGPDGGTQKVWVYLRDKGGAAGQPASVSPRALARRALRGNAGEADGWEERPIDPAYVAAIAEGSTRVRQVSRWFGAVSVEATADQVRALAALPFVARLDVVRGYRARPGDETDGTRKASSAPSTSRPPATPLDYGDSFEQLEQIHVPSVHDLGFHGEGVVIGVFDAGFSKLAHEVFASTRIVARHDFVNGDGGVGNGSDRGEGSHGTATLSVIGGFRAGELIGPAFAAEYVLAKTEDTESETPIEEDNWAAAAEWAEALGVDVVSTSLGYLTFDPPFQSYTPAEMNGKTAIVTRAAEKLAARGVVVVASAGNSGFNPSHNTLGAPADGRHVLAAGAVGSFGERADFSSVGPTADGRIKPDVAARGVLVKAASSATTSGYELVSGTSFSCPLTAGVAALVLQAHPTYTVNQVRAVLRSTASQASDPDNLLGYGIVNALAAVRAKAPPSR
jgi:subtilisin family serine protease